MGERGKSVTGACVRAVIWVETMGSDKVAPLYMVTHLMIVLGLGLAREFAVRVVAIYQPIDLVFQVKQSKDALGVLCCVLERRHLSANGIRTGLYALVRAHTRTLDRSMSSKSLRNAGSGLMICSSGREPSHLRSKSMGSEQGKKREKT